MESLDGKTNFALAKSSHPVEVYKNNQDTLDEEAQMSKEYDPQYKGDLPAEETNDSNGQADFNNKLVASGHSLATTSGKTA
ncbi:hypothetical protein FRC09_016986, partial [Ceratobasidium sp. 395]